MTIDQMLARGYTLDRISQEVRRQVFAWVLREERKKNPWGAKGRAAARLGVHRNTVSRELWHKLVVERDPPLTQKEIFRISQDTKRGEI